MVEWMGSQMAADMACALLHTLWQGLVLAAGLMAVLKCLPAGRSALRYRASVLALLAVVVCWVGTFSILQYEAPAAKEAAVSTGPIREPAAPAANLQTPTAEATAAVQTKRPVFGNSAAATPKENSQATKTVEQPDSPAAESRANVLGWVAAVWIAGVVVMLGRMFVMLCGTAKLKRSAVDITEPRWVEPFENLCHEMGMTRAVRFAATHLLTQPGVIGFFRPVLLVPVSILSEISVEDLRAILAHELAHIRRYDFLVNFGQMLVEAVLFFNPAVWWISRRIRIEREACCDAAGVKAAGRPVKYAQILFEQIRRGAGQSPNVAVAGFSDDDKNASTERVSRIIHPQQSPRMKIGAVKLTLWLLIAAAVLVGLWKAADATVAVTAKILTPAERIEKITEIAETHSSEYNAYKDTDRVTLSGTVTTHDGKALPRNANVIIQAYGRHSSSTQINLQKDGSFKHSVQCLQNVFVGVEVDGYAPGFSKIYHPEPNEVIDNIQIMLTDGFDGKVQVVNEQGEPIPNAVLDKCYFTQMRNGWSGHGHSQKFATDENGVATFKHCLEKPVKMYLQVAGFQKIDSADYTLKPGEMTTVVMQKGLVASGTVVAAKTGKPIEGARFRLVSKERPAHSWSYGMHGDNYETASNASGEFVLDRMAEGFKYTYVITAEGYNRTALAKAQPGDKKLVIKMLPELTIKGKIIGDLSRLGKSYCVQVGKSVPAVRFDSRFTDNNRVDAHVHDSDSVPVEIKDGVGTFTLKNILGSRVTITPAGTDKQITVNLQDESIDDVVIDLDAANNFYNNVTTRPLVITLKTPEGCPPINGAGSVSYISEEDTKKESRIWQGLDIRFENNVGTVELPVPCCYRIANVDQAAKGYWIEPDDYDINNIVRQGDEPVTLTVEAKPGGSIYGQILNEEGNLIPYADLHLLVVERPGQYVESHNFHGIKSKMTSGFNHRNTETGRFNSPTLLLGGTYAIAAYNKDTCWISKPIELTEEEPIREITLQLKQTESISGRIFLPDKSPAEGVEVRLGISARYSEEDRHNRTGTSVQTDANGQFTFEKINPQKPLEYTLRIKPGAGYQPLTVKVKPGSDKTYRLEKGFTLTGRVIDQETGWPIPEAWVSAEASSSMDKLNRHRSCDEQTDKDGKFIFTTLNDERYRLYMGGAEIVKPAQSIIGGEDQTIELTVRLHSWSQLKAREPEGN